MQSLPPEAEIASLPLWAAVALAAHCARRLLPVLKAGYPKAPPAVMADIERAIAIAEQFATTGNGLPNYAGEADADHAIDAAGVVRSRAKDPAVWIIADAAGAAAYAAGAAADLAAGASWANRETVDAQVGRVLRAAWGFDGPRAEIAPIISALIRAAADRGWTDATPVAPSFFS